MMEIVYQPPKSLLCGQAVVAMLAGVALDEAVAAMGGGRKYPIELRRGAMLFGIRLTRRGVPADTEQGDGRGPKGAHGACLIHKKTAYAGKPVAHWIAWDGEVWLDPALGKLRELPRWAIGSLYLVI